MQPLHPASVSAPRRARTRVAALGAMALALLAAPAPAAAFLPFFKRAPKEEALIDFLKASGAEVNVRVGDVGGGLRGMIAGADTGPGGVLVSLPSSLSVPMGPADFTSPVGGAVVGGGGVGGGGGGGGAWGVRPVPPARSRRPAQCDRLQRGRPFLARPLTSGPPPDTPNPPVNPKPRQENTVKLLERRFGDPGWHTRMAPFWRMFPEQGSVFTKETFTDDEIAMLQDPQLARGVCLGWVGGFWGMLATAAPEHAEPFHGLI